MKDLERRDWKTATTAVDMKHMIFTGMTLVCNVMCLGDVLKEILRTQLEI